MVMISFPGSHVVGGVDHEVGGVDIVALDRGLKELRVVNGALVHELDHLFNKTLELGSISLLMRN